MKQLIVMISMVALGISIGGFVMGFQGIAEEVAKSAAGEITMGNITTPTELGQ